jgi:hypothetical protein
MVKTDDPHDPSEDGMLAVDPNQQFSLMNK